MTSKIFRNLAAAAFCMLAGIAAAKNAGRDATDTALIAAYDAYRAGDALGFARHAKKLEGHVLEPWLDYWRLSMRLEDANNREVREFFASHANQYVNERLRSDWLRVLGKRSDWQEFERQAPRYLRDDLEVSCYRWIARLEALDDSALEEAQSMWLEPLELPEGCQRLSVILSVRGRLSITDIWRRVRVLFEHGQITAAKTALGLLPRGEGPDERMLARSDVAPPGEFRERVARLYELSFGRAPRDAEIASARDYLGAAPDEKVWINYVQALLMTNEFTFID